MINLVVFDLDGTLVDSRRDLADATNALIVELGGRVLSEERVTAMVGDGAAMLIRRALTAASLDPDTPGVLDRFLVHYDARLLDHTRPYPGMVETLAALSRRVRLAVLTTSPPRRPNGSSPGWIFARTSPMSSEGTLMKGVNRIQTGSSASFSAHPPLQARRCSSATRPSTLRPDVGPARISA